VLAFTSAGRDPRTAGALLAAWGGGAMAGSLAGLRGLRTAAPLRLAAWAWAGQAAALWILVADRSPVIAAGALAASGVANGLRVPPIAGATAHRLAAAERAATLTAASCVVLGAGFAALLVAGPALEHGGVVPVLVAIGALQTAAAAVFARAAGAGAPPSQSTP
jgi:hypothetical protein